ncbi:MAG TPA: peptidoglycan DD-metalloendopeptidase family protein [Chthoniobacterales bacterium]|nr:peptidoglycan DD-metalloendopeptidase family protein [Chthoniobacterales bacterium]
MRTSFLASTFFCFALLIQIRAQDVEIVRQAAVVKETTISSDEHLEAESATDEQPATASVPVKAPIAKVAVSSPKPAVAKQPAPKLTIEQMRRGGEMAAERLKKEVRAEQAAVTPVVTAPANKTTSSPPDRAVREPDSQLHFANFSGQTAFIRLADGFDFPVGKPDAKGYYKARGFRANGHLGEDWDGVGGGDTDLGDPIYCIGDGVVVFARDCHMGWGNVIIVRHVFRENGTTHNVDSLYGHLQKILVFQGQKVRRGEQIATLGNAHGLYDAHLHLEIRKNIEIGMSRAKFAQDYSNYYDPSQFISAHRHLASAGTNYRVALNTFTQDARIPWDKLKNYSHAHTGGGSGESAIALKKALASQPGQ